MRYQHNTKEWTRDQMQIKSGKNLFVRKESPDSKGGRSFVKTSVALMENVRCFCGPFNAIRSYFSGLPLFSSSTTNGYVESVVDVFDSAFTEHALQNTRGRWWSVVCTTVCVTRDGTLCKVHTVFYINVPQRCNVSLKREEDQLYHVHPILQKSTHGESGNSYLKIIK